MVCPGLLGSGLFREKVMKYLYDELRLRIIKAMNVVLLTAPFTVCWFVCYSQSVELQIAWDLMVVLLFAVIYITYGRIYDAFLVSLNRISEMIYSQLLAVLISDGIMYVVTGLLIKEIPDVRGILLTFFAQGFLSAAWCVLAHRYYFQTHQAKKTLIVCDHQRGMNELINAHGLEKKFDVQGSVRSKECIENDMGLLDGMQAVFVSGVPSHERNLILKACVQKSIDVYVLPKIGDILMSGAKQTHMFHLPMLKVRSYHPTLEYLVIKRLFDIVASGLMLLLASPVMLVTAAAIKCQDGGPVFYKQCRLTKDGKEFYVLKFRSMRVDAEKDGVARLSTGDKDDRITPVGRLIRKVRIDELPQLLNILKGEMAIVGPRPERPEIAAQYAKKMPEFRLRLQAKAGLTGYAQVYGKYNSTPYDKLQMDLMYISHPSFMEDLRIIFATIKILFMPESTEGVAENAETAMGQGEKGIVDEENTSCYIFR